MNNLILNTLMMYALAFVISFAVAGLIKLISVSLALFERPEAQQKE